METKKAKKAREIAERKAAKEAAKQAEHSRVFSTPIAKAVAPLKISAVAAAEVAAQEWVAKRLAELEAAEWDINKVAPYPKSGTMSREEYRRAQNKRHAFDSITSWVETSRSAYQSDEKPHFVKKDPKGIALKIERAKDYAAAQYEAFVYKMVVKVGEHKAARLETIAGVWGESFLYVTLSDDIVQKWKTQTILNCSVYGLIFNQWPSRIVK
jgi:hypothetical protein